MQDLHLERFLSAIGYPDRFPNAEAPVTLRVDGRLFHVEVSAGRIRLSHVLSDDPSLFPSLAAFAAGRMLREDASLACADHSAFLWQDASADADSRSLVRFFETFADSCDWWRARVDERGGGEVQISEAVIRP